MKRVKITLSQIAERNNLAQALYKAAKAKRHRAEVIHFLSEADTRLNRLSVDILHDALPYGRYRHFTIHDPKKRLIQAACFEDRVFHHALMNIAGTVLERAMSPTSFACRPDKGVHRAIELVQQNIRKYAWYCQVDIAGYFASIEHEVLLQILMKRFKGKEVENQFLRILQTYQDAFGRGLPIGALTSQYFANYYLDGLDRFFENHPHVRAHIRYMDDIVWWCDSKQAVKGVLDEISMYLSAERKLQLKPDPRIQRSPQGIAFCGFRVLPGIIRMSKRRKQRYQQRRAYWERLYAEGWIDERQLQTAYAAVFAIGYGTNSVAWRQENLRKYPQPVV
jgi:retron-type reverse transcriptase